MKKEVDSKAFNEELQARQKKNIERFSIWLHSNGETLKSFARLIDTSYPRILRHHNDGKTMYADNLTAAIMLDPNLSLRWLMGLDDIDQDQGFLTYKPIKPVVSTADKEEYQTKLDEAQQMITAMQKRLLEFKVASLQINEEEQKALAIGKALMALPEGQEIIEKYELDTYNKDKPKEKR